MWMNYIYAKWKWKKQCFDIIEQRISAKNMNNDFVIFRDKIKIFFNLVVRETRSRFVSSTSRASRRDREFLSFGLMLWDESENFCLHSCDSRQEREQCLKKALLLRDGFLFLAQWIIKRFQIKGIFLMLEGLFDCILKKYSSIGSKNYYILLLWTRGAFGGVLLELLAPWTVVIDWYQLP